MSQDEKDQKQQPKQKPSQAEGERNPGEDTTKQPPKPSQAEGEPDKTEAPGLKKS